MKVTLLYPMYSFTMYSLRGTWSVGFAGWFSLWVMFYVFDEWFMGKLWSKLGTGSHGIWTLPCFCGQTVSKMIAPFQRSPFFLLFADFQYTTIYRKDNN